MDSESGDDRDMRDSDSYILLGEGERKVRVTDKGGAVMFGGRGIRKGDGERGVPRPLPDTGGEEDNRDD